MWLASVVIDILKWLFPLQAFVTSSSCLCDLDHTRSIGFPLVLNHFCGDWYVSELIRDSERNQDPNRHC